MDAAPQAAPADAGHGFTFLGVVGSGAMGRGIAQLFAQAGIRTALHDSHPAALAAATEAIMQTWDSLRDKGRLSADQVDRARAMLQPVESLAALAGCDLVIEAISEDAAAKHSLFRALEAILPAHAALASNTSSLSITALASGLGQPQRLAGYHFFNPVPLMRIVEVVAGVGTAPGLPARLVRLAEAAGHRAVLCTDTPGFIVNHAGRGYGTEALRILAENVAPVPVIDRILREQVNFAGQGFRLGPFELLDLTGLDVSHPVMESIYHQYYQEPRFRPSVITAQRKAAGLYGRKSGQGFYAYREGKKAEAHWPWTDAVHKAGDGDEVSDPPVWIAPMEAAQPPAVLHELQHYLAQSGTQLVTTQHPPDNALIILCPLGEDASAMATRLGVDARRAVAIDTLFPFGWQRCKLRSLMTTPASAPLAHKQACRLFSRDGAAVALLSDSPGFVTQRVVAMIIAIACDMAQQAIARPHDIDDAVRIGLAYPLGPLSMGDALGAARICALLGGLHACTGDPRYRPSAWLRRRADLGLSLLHA